MSSCNYSPFMRNVRCFGKLKWITIIFICFALSMLVILHHLCAETPLRDTYNDDVSKEVYDYVMQKWFNYSGPQKWFNKKNISMFDTNLLDELRKNWIFRKISNDSSHWYSGLQQPFIKDQSMGQAQAIRKIFNNKKNGVFIECGAYDGETRSNTLSLERYLGWTGLLIEADPINFTKMLNRNRQAYLTPTCLSIQPYPMNVSFLMARNIGRIHENINSISKVTSKNTPDRAHKGIHVGVQCFPLASYIAALEIKTVDYLSLDVEGNEMDILKTIPFNDVNIKTLSVEYSHVAEGRKAMIKYMDKQGYYVHSFVTHPNNLANDIIFVKRSYSNYRSRTLVDNEMSHRLRLHTRRHGHRPWFAR